MNKSRVWIAGSMILLFAAGIVAGIVIDKWFLNKRPALRRPQGQRPSTLDIWTKELGLSVEQQAKLREIFQKNDERMKSDERLKALRTDYNKRMGEIRAQLKGEIDAVLTPEQIKKLEAMIQKHASEFRKRNAERNDRNDRSSRPRESRPGDTPNN
jgi:Spy/CpxP family protein refolding chaperone